MIEATSKQVDANLIWSEALRLSKAAMPSVLTYALVLTLAGILADQQQDVVGTAFLSTALALGLGYWMLASMVAQGGLASTEVSVGLGVYFGLSLLSGLGIALGALLLVLPGLFLMIRWLPIFGYCFAEGENVSDAFARAWADTDGHFAPLALAFSMPLVLYIAGFVFYFIASDDFGAIDVLPSAVSNLALTLASVAYTAIGIATYSLLGRSSKALTQVFE